MKTPLTKKEKAKKDWRDNNWEMQFFELQKFKKKHGHCHVPGTHINKNNPYLRLAHWCGFQRQLKKFEPLKFSPDRLRKLNEIGFSWDRHDARFESKFRQLKLYREKHGHSNVQDYENPELAHWCSKLRTARRRKDTSLTNERVIRLNKLDFAWHDKQKVKWEKHFTWLKNYHKKHGHCNVSKHENSELVMWCRSVRQHRNNNRKSITKERISRLNDLGFKWDNHFDLKWEQRIAELIEYKKKYGHYYIPATHNNSNPIYSLGQWVAFQRRYYHTKSQYMTAQRIAKLNSIGFSWVNPIPPGKRINTGNRKKTTQINEGDGCCK